MSGWSCIWNQARHHQSHQAQHHPWVSSGFEVLGATTAGCVVASGVTDGCVSPQAEIGLKTQEAFV